MRAEDRLSFAGILIGAAGGVASTALPLAFPSSPAWLWHVLLWLALTVLVGSSIFLAYDLGVRPRNPAGTKMDPLGVAELFLVCEVLRKPITLSHPAASALHPTTPEFVFARRSHPW
jgi:hypothetical protein